MNKYLRFTLGIPTFSLGVGLWMADLDVSGWSLLWMIMFSLYLIYIGLWLLDVPSVNTTTVNLNLPQQPLSTRVIKQYMENKPTIREGFKYEFLSTKMSVEDADLIADYWLNKIKEVVENRRSENKKTEKWSDDYYHALDDLLKEFGIIK